MTKYFLVTLLDINDRVHNKCIEIVNINDYVENFFINNIGKFLEKHLGMYAFELNIILKSITMEEISEEIFRLYTEYRDKHELKGNKKGIYIFFNEEIFGEGYNNAVLNNYIQTESNKHLLIQMNVIHNIGEE